MENRQNIILMTDKITKYTPQHTNTNAVNFTEA